jgi:hypothetical protein
MVTDAEKQILLDFQRAKYAFNAFPEVDKARATYIEETENLKKITDPVIAELVRRMFQEWLKDVTPDSCSTNVARGEDIMLAEKELYEMTFQFGDNTLPNATNLIQ